MRRAALALVALLLLAGCGEGYVTEADREREALMQGLIEADKALGEQTVTLRDGREVTCIVGSRALDCDWEGAR